MRGMDVDKTDINQPCRSLFPPLNLSCLGLISVRVPRSNSLHSSFVSANLIHFSTINHRRRKSITFAKL